MTKKLDDLLKSKHFCVMPFIHACVWTDGRSIPCCINQEYEFGKTLDSSMSEIYSNDNLQLTSFRKEMLSGHLPQTCHRCKTPEEELGAESYRIWANNKFGHHLSKMIIGDDGKIEKNNIVYYDVRFSNLCNLKCRMCDELNSSAIAQEKKTFFQTDLTVQLEPFNDFENFSSFLQDNLDSLEEIYFCGGEPLFLEYHYRLMELLIKNNKTDVQLRYNSNLTRLSFKEKNILEYWKLFKHVHVSASIDSLGLKGEYIRHGSKWADISSNLLLIKQSCPHVSFQWCPTVQILNVFEIENTHIWLIDNKVIKPDDVHYNILTDPKFFSITILPDSIKAELEKKWEDYATKIASKGASQGTLDRIRQVISYMKQPPVDSLENFKKNILIFDKLRNEKFAEIFPEYKNIL